MKYVVTVCVLLTLLTTSYGQQPGIEPRVSPLAPSAEPWQPDPSGRRLSQLLQTAGELQQAGNPDQAAAVLKQADRERQALLHHLDALQAEIERIRLVTSVMPQVVVRVHVIELSLTKLRQLGFDLTALGGLLDAQSNTPQKNSGFRVVDSEQAERLLESLRKDHLARFLAEPTLVTLSGKTAVFATGGEVPIPKREKNGSASVDYQHYGTHVSLTPEVLGTQTVRLAIRCRLAEISQMVPIGKENAPALASREFELAAEIPSGRMLVLNGMNQRRMESVNRGLPWISELPWVGKAFAKTTEEVNDLVMLTFVRPEIVPPRGGEVRSAAPALPEPAAGRQVVRPVNGPR